MSQCSFIAAAALCCIAVLAGCRPRESRDAAGARVESNRPKTEQFLTKVNAVRPGTPMPAVREELGKPDEVRRDTVSVRAEPGPAERLPWEGALPGARYEHWIYKRGDSHYHVFFTRGTRGGDADWEVVSVRSTPKNAVY